MTKTVVCVNIQSLTLVSAQVRNTLNMCVFQDATLCENVVFQLHTRVLNTVNTHTCHLSVSYILLCILCRRKKKLRLLQS